MSFRDEIAELGREQDRLQFEHRQWTAKRETIGAPLMRQSELDGILYRTTEQNAQAADARARGEDENTAAAPSDDEQSKGDLLSEALIDVGGRVIADLRREWRRELEVVQAKSREIIAALERDRERDPLKAEVVELRAKLDMLVAMLGKSNKLLDSKADVIDLPDWRKRSDVA
jgi:hypothetical protein